MADKDRVLEEVILIPEATPVPAVARAVRAAQAAHPPGDPRLAALEEEVGRLRLYTSVLLHLVLSRGLVSKDDLRALVTMADLEDGVADGRRAGDPLG